MSPGPLYRSAQAVLIVAALSLAAGIRAAHTEPGAKDSTAASGGGVTAEDKARFKKLDAGPRKIDVSSYPAEQKAAYPLFVKKCSKCHSIGRPINSDFVLPSQWERYVKRMTFKPNSKITPADGKSIYHFLVYDSSVRKAAALKARLAELGDDDRAAELAKLKAINPGYKAD